MKTCKQCNQTKPKSEFYRLRRGDEARQSKCKTCVAQNYREHRQRDLKASRRRDRERYRLRTLSHSITHESEHLHIPDEVDFRKRKIAAMNYVRDAVRRGAKWASSQLATQSHTRPILFRPPCCPWCRRHTRHSIEAHHYHGYGSHSDIIWVCRRCHIDIHVLMREAKLDGTPPIEGFQQFLRDHGV